MARNFLFLNQAMCTVIIDGVPVFGFAPGDSIKITPNAEGSAVEVGLDGAVTQFSTDMSGEFEIDLMPTSPFLDVVNAQWLAQKTAAAVLMLGTVTTSAAEPFALIGMSIADPGAVQTGGKAVTPRTVKFKVQRIVMPV